MEQARRRDTGYILLAGGRRAFEKATAYRLPMRNWAARLNRSLGVGGYMTAISLVAAILLDAPLLFLSAAGVGPAVLGLLGALGAIPAIDAAVALVCAPQRLASRGPKARTGATPIRGIGPQTARIRLARSAVSNADRSDRRSPG